MTRARSTNHPPWYNGSRRLGNVMCANRVESSGLRPLLRWYQFSLRGLFLFTLFVAILLSILSVGWTVRYYEATITVARRLPVFSDESPPVDFVFHNAVQDSALELANSSSLAEVVTRALRQKGIRKIDGEYVETHVVRRHVVVKDGGCLVDIIASSSDPEIGTAVAITFFRSWFAMPPAAKPMAMQGYFERAKLDYDSGLHLEGFESDWRNLERRLQSNVNQKLRAGDQPMSLYFALFGDKRESAHVRPIYPYWNSCRAIASVWLGLGGIAFVINRWNRYRLHRRSSCAKTNDWPLGPEEAAGPQTDSRAAPLAGSTDAPSEHTCAAGATTT